MVRPSGAIFRVGWGGELWHPRLGGNGRFDDVQGRFRVLYACSQRRGCFVETLACYRLDDVLLSQLDEISGPADYVALGTVALAWFKTRAVGAGHVCGEFADICHSESLSEIATRTGFRGTDMSSLQSPQRQLTQGLSGEIYRDMSSSDSREYSGIRYLSRFGNDLENWAIYDRVTVTGTESDIAVTDADLEHAVRLLRITLATED